MSSEEIDAKVWKSLEGTTFATSSLQKLSGGSVNWIYHAKLLKPLDDGTTEVALKHGENYMATIPDFELNPLRCRIESECLRRLSDCPFTGKTDPEDSFSFRARTPKLLHFDEVNCNQFYEYLSNGVNLKEYVLQHYPAPTSEIYKPECQLIGKVLGRWLKNLHAWSLQKHELQEMVRKHTQIHEIKHMVNFLWMYDRVEQYPDILGDVKGILEQVEKMALAEHEDKSKLQIIHGDFWTGNVLLPNSPLIEGVAAPLFIIDWESLQFGLPAVDIGQMIAEMYALWLYKSIHAGLWMMEAFAAAYGDITEDGAFRTALQAGAHLLCTTTMFPGWGTTKEVEAVASVGRDIIIHAWKKDRAWVETRELACLFTHIQ